MLLSGWKLTVSELMGGAVQAGCRTDFADIQNKKGQSLEAVKNLVSMEFKTS